MHDYDIVNYEDCHPAVRVKVFTEAEILEIIDGFHVDWQNIKFKDRKLSNDEIIEKASFLILIKEDLKKQIKGEE